MGRLEHVKYVKLT